MNGENFCQRKILAVYSGSDKEMTENEEIQKKIAKLKGWQPIDIDYWGEETGLQKELGQEWFDTAEEDDSSIGLHWVNLDKHISRSNDLFPNWPESIADAWELIEEVQKEPHEQYVNIERAPCLATNWRVTIGVNHGISGTLPMAICEAYIHWEESQ
jgi:hypothetical protein